MSTNTHEKSGRTPGQAPLEAVEEVLEVFRRRAETLRFPEIDTATLDARAEGLERLSQAVTEARLRLEAAETARREGERELVELARRAYAYACVYAHGDAELKRELDTFEFATSQKARRKRERSVKAMSGVREPAAATPSAKGPGGRKGASRAAEPDASARTARAS